MKVVINTHEHYWDCETCGFAGSTTIGFESDELGRFEDGEPATCFSGRDGYIQNVLKELNKRLSEKDIVISLKEYDAELEEKFYEVMEAKDWDYEILSDAEEVLRSEFEFHSDEYEAFYSEDNLIKYYSQYGIELEFTTTSDGWDDYDSDEHDEYYSEMFDNGYTTDESYDDLLRETAEYYVKSEK